MLDFYGGNWQVFLAQAPLAVEAGLATVYHFCPQESTNFIILLMTFLLLWQKLKWQLISNSIYKCLQFDLEKCLPLGCSPPMFMVLSCHLVLVCVLVHFHFNLVSWALSLTGYKKRTGQFLRAAHVYSIDKFVTFLLK